LSDILVTTERIWALRAQDPTSVVIAAPKTAPTHEDPKLADVVARPKFSATARVAEAIEERLEEKHRTRVEEQRRTHQLADRKSPRWRVSSASAGVSASADADVVVWGNEGTSDLSMFAAYRNRYLPLGLDMLGPSAEPGLSADAYAWHPAARASFAAARSASPPKVAHVFFPVLAAVLPKWINGFAKNAEDANDAPAPRRVETFQKTRRVLYLVSGYGAPVNASHAPESNSTEAMARLMKKFVELAYPGLIDVRLAHSGTASSDTTKTSPS